VLISAREAAQLLRRAGVNRDRARRLLAAGFAGPGVRTAASVLFEHDLVRELCAWPHVDHARLVADCPEGIYVARVSAGHPLDVGTSWHTRVTSLELVPDGLSAITAVFLITRIQDQGPVPWVATVSGFVAFGADLTGFRGHEDGRPRFVLHRPGTWFESVSRRRFETGPGRPWSIWGWEPYARVTPPAAKYVIHRDVPAAGHPPLQE
jgi:hypothetical protein